MTDFRSGETGFHRPIFLISCSFKKISQIIGWCSPGKSWIRCWIFYLNPYKLIIIYATICMILVPFSPNYPLVSAPQPILCIFWQTFCQTRMHSSRMCTTRSLPSKVSLSRWSLSRRSLSGGSLSGAPGKTPSLL